MEEELTKAVIDLVKGIKSVAPEVWAIAVRQSYVNAFKYLAGFFVAIIVSIILGRYFYRMIGKEKTGEEEVLMLVSAFFGIFTTFSAIMFFVDGVSFILNPEYYAIKLLMEIVK